MAARALGTNVFFLRPYSSPRKSSSEAATPADAKTATRETDPLTGADALHNKQKKKSAAALNSELEESPLNADLESPMSPLPPQQQLSWKERAKTFAIEYGRVGVCTHIVLSLVSFSAIYASVSAGIDVSAILDTVGFSVSTSESTANSAGSFVIAYAMYKLLAPVRWPLTFAVTPVVMRALRKRGYMLPNAALPARRSPPPNGSSSPET